MAGGEGGGARQAQGLPGLPWVCQGLSRNLTNDRSGPAVRAELGALTKESQDPDIQGDSEEVTLHNGGLPARPRLGRPQFLMNNQLLFKPASASPCMEA